MKPFRYPHKIHKLCRINKIHPIDLKRFLFICTKEILFKNQEVGDLCNKAPLTEEEKANKDKWSQVEDKLLGFSGIRLLRV
jgi:hypothetical protein